MANAAATGEDRDEDPLEDPLANTFAAKLEEQQDKPFPWKAVVKRSVVVVVAGVAFYLVAPSVIAVFHSWPRLTTLDFVWLAIALGAEIAHFACTFGLQRVALRTKSWFPVVTAQLAGNSISRIVPGGAAAGAAVQFRMLAASGMDASTAVGGLTAFSLLGIAGLLVLPVLVLPTLAFGSPVSSGFYAAAILGAVAFVVFTGFGAVVVAANAPLETLGRGIQGLHNRILSKRGRMSGLPARLIVQRDLIRTVLGKNWLQATALSVGRLALDFICLFAAVRAVGSHPRPTLVLLVYAVAGVIGLVPITPGGLGVIEASMSGLLVLAGLTTADAVLATLTYRLVSYWIPLMAGPVAYALFKRKYRRPRAPGVSSAEPSAA